MGLLDVKWVVEIEYSDGFLHSNKTDSIMVDAPNDYEAKRKVKDDPQYQHKYLWIKSVKRFNSKPKAEVHETTYESQPLSDKERADIRARLEEDRRKAQLKIKQLKISEQQAKIKRIERSPTVAGVVGVFLTLFAFLLGWIPYWYYNALLNSIKEKVLWYEKIGADPNSYAVRFLYERGMYAKGMRDSVIWIPFVILAVGVVITIIVVSQKNKSKPDRLRAAKKELEELKK